MKFQQTGPSDRETESISIRVKLYRHRLRKILSHNLNCGTISENICVSFPKQTGKEVD